MTDVSMFERIVDLFHRAAELPPRERAAFLDRECDDPGVRREVEDLLDADQDLSPTFLADTPRIEVRTSVPDVPSRIGPYRVRRRIGEGGMGVVYEAEQEHPRRRVALKVLRAGSVTQDILRRFERESRVLGQLQHPGIAHVYSAETADIGGQRCPYFVMEYIEGRPLDVYLDAVAPSTRARLELFARICEAVEHAHERGVVHRDLKPANILVVDGDGGRPKVLDFGVARMVRGAPDEPATLQTETGQVVGTVGYMSPEQLRGDARHVDARSDVYALGVVLYQMLAGRFPHELRGKPIAEVARIVQDEEPTRIGSYDPEWRGDVETIVEKALEKEPGRRYESAAALAGDVRRFLDDQPIVARAPSVWYRTSKLARRHRGLFAGLVATFVTLLVGLVVSTAAFVRADEQRAIAESERQIAESERRTAEAVTEFLAGMIGEFNPNLQGKEVTLRRVIEESEPLVDSKFAGEPEVRVRLKLSLARAFVQLGDHARTERLARALIETAEAELGPDDAAVHEGRCLLGVARFFAGDYAEARRQTRASVEGYARVGLTDTILNAEALSALGLIETRLGNSDQADAALVEAQRIYDRQADPDSLGALQLLSQRAIVYTNQERYEEAEPMYLDLISRAKRALGPTHPEVALAVANLAAQYNRTGRSKEAIPLMEEALGIQRETLGEAHAKTLITLNNLGVAHGRVGEYDRAIALLREGMATAEEAHGKDSPSGVILMHSLGRQLQASRRFDEAEIVLLRHLELREARHAKTAFPALRALLSVLWLRRDQGRTAEAMALAETLESRVRSAEGLAPSRQCRLLLDVAVIYAANGAREKAEWLLKYADELEVGARQKRAVRDALVELYTAWDRPRDAARYRTEAADEAR